MPKHNTTHPRIPKFKTVRPRIYRNKDGFISSILVKEKITARFKFDKKDIVTKTDKQIIASRATVILQNLEGKTDVVTFMLETVEYKKFGNNLTKLAAVKGIIESHVHKITEEMTNLNLVFEHIN